MIHYPNYPFFFLYWKKKEATYLLIIYLANTVFLKNNF